MMTWSLPDILFLIRFFGRQTKRFFTTGVIKLEETKNEIQQKTGQIS